jgi:hypothetical protein
MNPIQERQLNQTAFRRLKGQIDGVYPVGRFVAIAGGQIVADAARFADLDSKLASMGNHSRDALVVQAGADYPDFAMIFAFG